MNSAVQLLQRIVQIDSPTGQEQEMADFLMEFFSRRKIFAERDAVCNVFARINGTGEPFFLSAHMDTVEPGRGIIPRVADGVIRSSGDTVLGADNKAAIAAILSALDLLDPNHRPLELLFTVDEESKNTGAKAFDYKKVKAKKGIVADIAAPIGTTVTASPAYVRFSVLLRGTSSHAAFPERAHSILKGLGSLLSEVKTGVLDEDTILNFGTIHAGNSRNTIPGSARIEGELRGFDDSLLMQHLYRLSRQWKKIGKQFGLSFKIEYEIDNRSYCFQQDDPFIKEIQKSFNDLHMAPRLLRSWSCSDGNIFNELGIQVVTIGDGTRKTHTVDESIRVADMEKLMQVLLSFMNRST